MLSLILGWHSGSKGRKTLVLHFLHVFTVVGLTWVNQLPTGMLSNWHGWLKFWNGTPLQWRISVLNVNLGLIDFPWYFFGQSWFIWDWYSGSKTVDPTAIRVSRYMLSDIGFRWIQRVPPRRSSWKRWKRERERKNSKIQQVYAIVEWVKYRSWPWGCFLAWKHWSFCLLPAWVMSEGFFASCVPWLAIRCQETLVADGYSRDLQCPSV